MSTDKREAILSRIHEILKGVEGSTAALRNTLEVSEAKAPFLILLDGDENADQQAFGRGRPAKGPNVLYMTPEVYAMDAERAAADIGPALSELRAKVVKAILTDEALAALAHDGDVRYEGCVTGLSVGRSMLGEAGLNFTVAYILKPQDL